MTYQEEKDVRVSNLAVRFCSSCKTPLDLPGRVYKQLSLEYDMRKNPYMPSFGRIKDIISEMSFEHEGEIKKENEYYI